MHYYPTNMKMQNIWRQVLCMKEPINKYKKVCNLHFKEDDFISPGKQINYGIYCKCIVIDKLSDSYLNDPPERAFIKMII